MYLRVNKDFVTAYKTCDTKAIDTLYIIFRIHKIKNRLPGELYRIRFDTIDDREVADILSSVNFLNIPWYIKTYTTNEYIRIFEDIYESKYFDGITYSLTEDGYKFLCRSENNVLVDVSKLISLSSLSAKRLYELSTCICTKKVFYELSELHDFISDELGTKLSTAKGISLTTNNQFRRVHVKAKTSVLNKSLRLVKI